jgi:hypothetical protein
MIDYIEADPRRRLKEWREQVLDETEYDTKDSDIETFIAQRRALAFERLLRRRAARERLKPIRRRIRRKPSYAGK